MSVKVATKFGAIQSEAMSVQNVENNVLMPVESHTNLLFGFLLHNDLSSF